KPVGYRPSDLQNSAIPTSSIVRLRTNDCKGSTRSKADQTTISRPCVGRASHFACGFAHLSVRLREAASRDNAESSPVPELLFLKPARTNGGSARTNEI